MRNMFELQQASHDEMVAFADKIMISLADGFLPSNFNTPGHETHALRDIAIAGTTLYRYVVFSLFWPVNRVNQFHVAQMII